MTLHAIIQSQYQAALEMLNQAISRCPEDLWNNPEDKNRFWQVAYHAIFYAHLYVQESEKTFTPWVKHRVEVLRLRIMAEPYSREEVLEYLEFSRQQIIAILPQLDLEGESGFHWLPFNKLELQIYSIRHIQQHAGELMERLGSRAGIDIDWVGRG
jgi:hypothetical protein